MSNRPRAGVIGASGIGKHHVKWLMGAGCDVVGFLGTSQEHVAQTQEVLERLCGFAGRGYTSLELFLGQCRPELVSVCSPAPLHYEHAKACLVAGAHVLCEKPLISEAGLDTPAQVYLGEKLVTTAAELGLILAVNTQYAAAGDHLRAICETGGVASSPVTEFAMQMESRGGGRAREYDAIWHDLAAHPLSVLLALVPEGRADWSSVQCILEPQRNECQFDFVSPGGDVCRARILLRSVPEGPMQRLFRLNGTEVAYEGRNDDDGVYCAYLSHEGRETKAQDFMEASITRFAEAAGGAGTVLATGAAGARNLEMQLKLLEGAQRRTA